MSGAGVRSFDHPRERPAPACARGRTLDGAAVVLSFLRPTLVVAVKTYCDGCREFITGDLEELSRAEVVRRERLG